MFKGQNSFTLKFVHFGTTMVHDGTQWYTMVSTHESTHHIKHTHTRSHSVQRKTNNLHNKHSCIEQYQNELCVHCVCVCSSSHSLSKIEVESRIMDGKKGEGKTVRRKCTICFC